MMNSTKELQIRPLSSLAKVFPNRVVGKITKQVETLRGQEVSFQIAFTMNTDHYSQRSYSVSISCPIQAEMNLYRVDNIPVTLAAYPGTDKEDKNYLSTEAGLYPDPLIPVTDGTVKAAMGLWRSVWISFRIPETLPAGEYPITVTFTGESGFVAKTTIRVKVHAISLPAQKLLFTQWFHCDCIADAHNVPVFSEAHWTLIEKYMKLAAEHGMNMILTPVVTPPLDTAVGSERPTVQLVDVTKNGDQYTFDFARLGRYVELAQNAGINYFEISHFFTQWGAKCAPKVVAVVNGKAEKIFGWETDATGPEYANFLQQLVPALIAYMEGIGVSKKQMYFHVSDEPSAKRGDLESYSAASKILSPLIKGCPHIDALSDLDFYQHKLVEVPVVSTNHITPYLEANVPGLWCYYCCGQGIDVSNRFLAMPSSRNRIIGAQMFKYNIAGFLQWGYNFYYGRRSEWKIDPWKTADGNCTWPAGDPFSVYPYGDEVIPSLRQKVFGNALEDMRLLALAEERIGHDAVVAELDRLAGGELTFSTCPNDDTYFEKMYQFIFDVLEK